MWAARRLKPGCVNILITTVRPHGKPPCASAVKSLEGNLVGYYVKMYRAHNTKEEGVYLPSLIKANSSDTMNASLAALNIHASLFHDADATHENRPRGVKYVLSPRLYSPLTMKPR